MANVANRTAKREFSNGGSSIQRGLKRGLKRKLSRQKLAIPALAALAGAVTLAAPQLAHAVTGTWTTNGNGLWSDTTKWAGGIVADGATFTADFSTINITVAPIVSLDSSRSIGILKFADTTQNLSWTLDNNATPTNILTLNNGASQPIITSGTGTTTGQNATISAVLDGTNGFIKNGPAQLTLSGANTISGQVVVNSAGTAGDLFLANNSALGTASVYFDPGTANFSRLLLNAGIAISNNITIHTARSAAGANGAIMTNGNVAGAIVNGTVTIDDIATSGGHLVGPVDNSMTNFLRFNGAINFSSQYTAGTVRNVADNNDNTAGKGLLLRAGNYIFAGGGSYFRTELRSGTLRLGATNGIATNSYIDMAGNGGNPLGYGILDLNGFNQTIVGVQNVINNGTRAIITNGTTAALGTSTVGAVAASGPATLTFAVADPNVLLTAGRSQSSQGNLVLTATGTGTGTASFITDNPASPLSIVVNGAANGSQTLNVPSSDYHGSTTLTSGTLIINSLNNGGAASSIGASTNAATNLVFDGGVLRYTGGNVTTDRNFTLNASKVGTIDVSTLASTLTMSGAGTGAGGFTKAGNGTLVFSSAQSYTGNTSVSAGTLAVNGSLTSNSNVSISAGATLAGTGSVAGVVTPASGGVVAPAGVGAVGTISVGGLTLNTGGQVNFEFGGGLNDQVTVSNAGGLTLNAGSLFLYNTGTTTAFSTNGAYTLFNINGGFSGLLDNLTISNPTAGKLYTLSSTASAVNLTIGTATTIDWTNANGTNLWTDNGDWSGPFPNAVGQTANFATAAGSGSVDLNGSKTVSGVIFNNSGTSYNLGGSGSLIVDNGAAAGAITVAAGTHTVAVPMVLNGALAISTTGAADSLTLAGNVTGVWPVTTTGPGTLNLTGTNSFTTLTATGGIVNVGTGGAGGTLGTGGVTLAGSATLNFNSSATNNFGQAITGNGSVNHLGTGTTTVGAISGVTTVNVSAGTFVTGAIGQSAGVNVTGSGSLTANGAVTGAGKLTVNSTGTVVLAAANTYSGGTQIDAGTVRLDATNALPNNTVLTMNGGTLDLNAKNVSLSNVLDATTSTGVITNNGANGTTSAISFTGFQAQYNMYAAINDGVNGGKVSLTSFIENNTSTTNGIDNQYRLALHASSTYSGGTLISKQSIEADATNALGTGPVTFALNNSSTNTSRLYVAGGITLPNNITIAQANAFAGFGVIQYLAGSTGSSTLSGTITVQADSFSGSTFAGPTAAADTLNITGAVNTAGTATSVGVRAGNVSFSGGGNYPRLDVQGTAIVGVANGVNTAAVVNMVGGTFDLRGNNQTVAGLTGTSGAATNSSATAASLTVNTTVDANFAGNITGNQSLVKGGAAIQTLAGANTYSGNTIIHGGTLKLSPGNVPVPIASYSFDDGAATNGGTGGTALDGANLGADLSQPGYNGTGKSATYSGFGESIDIASGITDLSPGSRWTVAAWIKTTQAGATILSKNTGGGWVGGNSVFYLSDGANPGVAGGRASAVRNGGGWVTGTTNVNDGTWRFVTYTSDGNVRRIYVNGVLETLTQAAFNSADVGNTVQLGYTSDTVPADGTQFLNGALDEVKFYDAGLTAAQVLKLFQTNGLGIEDLPNVLPVATAVNIDTAGGALDIGGVSQTIGSLTGVAGSSVILGPGTLRTGDASSTNFAGVISGTGGVTMQGAGVFTLSGANTYTGTTTVSTGTLTLASAGSLASPTIAVASGATANINGTLTTTAVVNANGATNFGGSTGAAVLNRVIGALNVGTGATASITASAFPYTPAVLKPTLLTFADPTAKMDLTNNELIVNEALATAVGRITSGQLFTTSTGGALGSLALSPTQTEVRFTLLGDTNLDGKVDVTDLGNLASNYGAVSGATWVQGDTNYSGAVDVTDLGNLASNYGGQLAAGPSAGGGGDLTATSLASVATGGAAVPEPASLGLIALGAVGLIGRRSRRHR